MKIVLSILLLLPFFVSSQTTALTYSVIPTTATDLNRPGGGAEQWTAGQNVINIPTQGVNTQRLDAYYRFSWYQLQSQSATGPGTNMDFSLFDAQVHDAINKGQKFSYGIMINYFENASQVASAGGTGLAYPIFLHNQMQAESTKDLVSGGNWYENTNSVSLRIAYKALNVQLSNHIATTVFMGVPYSSIVTRTDARIMGDFGENIVLPPKASLMAVNGVPTSAAIDSLLDIFRQAYSNLPNMYIVNMIGIFSGGYPGPSGVGVTPVDAGAFALQLTKNGHPYGWRRDNWGQQDNYIRGLLDLNTNTFGGFHFDTAIMNRFKFAPICGEPQDGGSETNFSDFVTEVQRYGGMSFGNGNFNNGVNATIQNNFRAASKAAGYRLILNAGGSVTGSQAGGPFQIVQHWRNAGAAPTYEDWNCVYDLRPTPTAAPVWSLTSSFNPKLFLPAGSDNIVTDNGTLTSVPAGTYELHMTMKDPLGYRFPMPIYITNTQQADGSYIILTNVVIGTSGAVANAGPNQNITTSSVTLSGSSSTGATSYLWTRISGPNTPTITTPTTVGTTVTGLVNGTYVFQLGINGGTTGSLIDQVQVVVAIPAVVANAGANQAIASPTSTTTVNGSGSSGPITSYLWTNISGPNTPTITTPSTVSTTITGLITGTYIVRLTLNGSVTDDVQITVSAAPVASAGPDQIIQLPTSSATVSASGSTGAVTYNWTRISGPNTPTITTPTTVSTTITGLIAGTYVYQVAINGGSTDQVTLTVNPIPVVANAGNNQTITLPTSTVSLSGSASTGATTYAWTNVSGPNVPTITTPTTVGTTITGLIAGTYVFQLSINSGASTSQVQVKVLPAAIPIANAGVSQTIALPTSSVSVSGSGSTGNITSYQWSSLSGPNAPVFSAATSVSTNITGLIQGVYLIQLALNGGTATDTMRVTVNPAAPPIPSGQTIFTTQIPAGGTLNDGNQGGLTGIELGMKFRSSVSGFVLGIRYFKTNQTNGGTKIGELYAYPSGTRLAAATFINEGVSGWQSVVFSSPVPIVAGTTYIAAYFSPNGNYVSSTGQMNTAIVNGNLTALADGTDGTNGVFKYSNSPVFPNAAFQKSNYWVDIIFASPNTNSCNCHPFPFFEKHKGLNAF